MTVEEMPSHKHTYLYETTVDNTTEGASTKWSDIAKSESRACGSTGGDKPHNNMEPYKVVYIFMRSA